MHIKKFLLAGLWLVLACTATPASAKTAPSWKATTPTGYTPITWVNGRGISSFIKAPSGNGYLDYLTVIYLPYVQINFFTSSTPQSWGTAQPPFDQHDATSSLQNWAVSKFVAEGRKTMSPDVRFFWNAPFFNLTIDPTDTSLAVRSTNATGIYTSSGSRPAPDMEQPRRMLIINNAKGTAQITDFDDTLFASTTLGDQAVEGFSPTVGKSDGAGAATARLFIGIAPNNKELVVYCSRGASTQEASDALLAAGVPLESQMQADGGASATCGYNLPGQYFVEPGRMLPYLMGALPVVARAKTTITDLAVRTGPGTKYTVLRRLPKNTPVTILQEKSGWARIGEGQWVSSSYIKKM